jgi:hypothetical protein
MARSYQKLISLWNAFFRNDSSIIYGSSTMARATSTSYDNSHPSEHRQQGRSNRTACRCHYIQIRSNNATEHGNINRILATHHSTLLVTFWLHEANRNKVTQARLHALTTSTPIVIVASRADPLFLHEIHVLQCMVFVFVFFPLVSLHPELQICGREHVRRS